MASLVSGGGAYLVGNTNDVMAWPGSADDTAYDSIPFGADEGLVARIYGIAFVVLGLPDPLYVVPTSDGAILAIAVCCDDDATLEALMASVTDDDWNPIGTFTATGSVIVFDSALSGVEAVKQGLSLQLKPGEYSVESRLFTPNRDSELQLVRLRGQ